MLFCKIFKICDNNKYCSGTPCGSPLWHFPSPWPKRKVRKDMDGWMDGGMDGIFVVRGEGKGQSEQEEKSTKSLRQG